MSLITLHNVSKSFGERVLFENVNLNIEPNMKIGFIGENGVGKTTLFRVIQGIEDCGGNVVRSGSLLIGIMEQTQRESSTQTAYEYVCEVFSSLFKAEEELETLRRRLESGEGDTEADIKRQDELNERYISGGGLTFRARVRSMLIGLGFLESEINLPLNSLSGGQKTRLSLARTLLSQANLLLLDEPTNHLDIESVKFLEDFLRGCQKAFIVISHDRYFLDRTTNMTIELENSHVTFYSGAYTEFQKKKKAEKEARRRKYENTMAEIKRIEGIIEQQRRWNRERNIKTAEHKQKSIDRLKETLEIPPEETDSIRFSFKAKRRSGNDVLTVNDLSKSYGEKTLFENVSFDVKRGERVFVLGANGCGKSTLYSMIKEARGTNDKIRFGTNVDCAFFDQSRSDIQSGKTVEQQLWDVYPKMDRTEIRNALAAFLFRGDDVQKCTDDLSGGEKARLSLLEIMLTGANFLLFDEPTNHLDIRSKEMLEEALSDFDGTVFIISHDRYLINKMADKLLVFEGTSVSVYRMSYDDYTEKIAVNKVAPQKEKQEKKEKSGYLIQKQRQSELRKMQTAVKRAEESIAQCETEIEEIQEKLNNSGSDFEEIARLSKLLEEKQQEEETLMKKWEEASLALEKMA